MDRKTRLQEQIRELDEQIREQRERIPPHSAKPEQIMQLEELEERREALQEELDSLE
ncbi:MAG: histidine kinase [Thermodesulfobacteriota bacterium]